MAELLVLINPVCIDGNRVLGEVSVVMEDGHEWGSGEKKGFAILKVPHLTVDEARAIYIKSGVPDALDKQAKDSIKAQMAAFPAFRADFDANVDRNAVIAELISDGKLDEITTELTVLPDDSITVKSLEAKGYKITAPADTSIPVTPEIQANIDEKFSKAVDVAIKQKFDDALTAAEADGSMPTVITVKVNDHPRRLNFIDLTTLQAQADNATKAKLVDALDPKKSTEDHPVIVATLLDAVTKLTKL